jgi:hypothetical protein
MNAGPVRWNSERLLDLAPDASEGLNHETYLPAVRDVIAARLPEPDAARLRKAKILYGAGSAHVYGTCYFDRWTHDETHDVIEIAAFSEESLEQLWITVAHECGHVLAGWSAGHGPIWKAAAKRLGMVRPVAAGPANINELDPDLVALLRQIPSPDDGKPVNRSASSVRVGGSTSGSPCPLGIGTAGGTSRGPGSGSRLRLYVCECAPVPVRVRIASDDFRARCLRCNASFKRATVGSPVVVMKEPETEAA